MSKTDAVKFDKEHTYEFINHGDAFTRKNKDVIGAGSTFRALASELAMVEKDPERFEHVRTLPFPPDDLIKRARAVSGMQRRSAPSALERERAEAKAGRKKTASTVQVG